MCVGAHVCVWGECAYVCMCRGQRTTSHSHGIPQVSFTFYFILMQGLSVLGTLEIARPTGRKLQGIQLSFPPQNWDYKEPSWQAVCGHMGSGA